MKCGGTNPHHVHFVGIGGIGMSALAQWYAAQGTRVSGSDTAASPVTRRLIEKGIAIAASHKSENLPAGAELVVYSDAVPEENPERAAARARGIPEQSYFEALGAVTRHFSQVVAVAGTHGKTTTTAMASLALHKSGVPLTAFVGSLVPQFPEGSNVLAAGDAACVVEACEYRNHLLNLSPTILVITNLEWDHTDWFLSVEALHETMRRAIARLPQGGALVYDGEDATLCALAGAASEGVVCIDYRAMDVPPLRVPGHFNRRNAQAAFAAACRVAPGSAASLREALGEFRGVWRRFEYKGRTRGGAAVYDDYAHHPTAVRETLRAARERFPEKRIIAAFQPHLYSRTRDLFDGFVDALTHADAVHLLPVYAARERQEDFPDVSSEKIARALSQHKRGAVQVHPTHGVLEAALRDTQGDAVIFILGAGDIYRVAAALVER